MAGDDGFRRAPASEQNLVDQASSGDVLEGGTRARRGRTVVGAAVLSGLALIGFLVTRSTASTAPTAQTNRPGPPPASAPDPGFAVTQVAFTDADHGYVLLSPCRLTTTSCGTGWSLLRTDDSGRHWHRAASPLDGRASEHVAVYARGRQNVALVIDGIRFVSTDAGRTWHERPPVTVAGPVRTAPVGDVIGYYCPIAVTSPTCPARLSAFDLITGISRTLENQPPLTGDPREQRISVVAAAGQVWVLATPPSGTPQLLHSTDGGVRWRTVPVPAGPAWFDPELLLAPDASRLYLVNRDIRTSHLQKVWRLADPAAGRWVPTVKVGPPEETVIQNVQVLPDGELRYTDPAGNAWLTRSGASLVAPAPKALMDRRPVNVNVNQVVDGVLVATPVVGLRGDRILISTDSAHHWQVHPVHR